MCDYRMLFPKLKKKVTATFEIDETNEIYQKDKIFILFKPKNDLGNAFFK